VPVYIFRRPPLHTLFPYTTLFRSTAGPATDVNSSTCGRHDTPGDASLGRSDGEGLAIGSCPQPASLSMPFLTIVAGSGSCDVSRSEEHTSELQSRFELVCRLLLEK